MISRQYLIQPNSDAVGIYIECAGILYGDIHKADIIKIHKQSGKVSLLHYDNFEDNPIPKLKERIKINLRTQQVDIFDYQDDKSQSFLYFKERYVAKDHPLRLQWEQYSEKFSMS